MQKKRNTSSICSTYSCNQVHGLEFLEKIIQVKGLRLLSFRNSRVQFMTAKTMKAAFSSTLRVLHIPGMENTDEHLGIISKNCHQLVDLNISQIEYTLENHIGLSWSSSVT